MSKVTVKPPDGGWGWVVVFSAFLIHLIADGVIYSFGAFFLEFTKYFKQTKSTTAWIGSVLTAMPLLTGPIAAYLTKRYGCKNVTIVGGLLSVFGFLLASISTSIFCLIITFGVIPGFGLSLCYIAALDIVAHYFDKRRSFAMGLAVCGGGIGTFFFAPLSQRFILWYGWETATALLSASFFVLSMCGFTMKDLNKSKNKSSKIPKKSSSQQSIPDQYNLKVLNNNSKPIQRSNSTLSLPTFTTVKKQKEEEQWFKRSASCKTKIFTVDAWSLPVVMEKGDDKTQDVGGTGASLLGNMQEWICTKLLATRNSLKNAPFLVFVLSNCILYIWYDVPYVYVQIAAVQQGYSDQYSSSLVSIIGLANLVGNIIFGYLGDKKWIQPTLLYSVILMISGGSVVLLPFCLQWNYYTGFVTCAVFGLTIAANCALTPVILVKIVSLEGFASAYGLLLCLQGVGNLVGPPVAGMISDRMGTNMLSFIVAGIGIFVSSAVLLLPDFQKETEIQPGSNGDDAECDNDQDQAVNDDVDASQSEDADASVEKV